VRTLGYRDFIASLSGRNSSFALEVHKPIATGDAAVSWPPVPPYMRRAHEIRPNTVSVLRESAK
jgi:hypothetical protein